MSLATLKARRIDRANHEQTSGFTPIIVDTYLMAPSRRGPDSSGTVAIIECGSGASNGA